MKASSSSSKFHSSFRLYLQSELTRRCQKNPKYSLRAFATLLGMDASSVSQMISGKRKASTKVIEQITNRLSTHPEQKQIFLQKAQTRKTGGALGRQASVENFELIAQDTFSFMSDWYHYAILELISVEDFAYRPAWISRALGITAIEAQSAIERMIRLGILREEKEHLVRTQKFVTNFSPGMTSAALKQLQRQVIEKALNAIDDVPQEEKDITSMTMAIDVEKLPEARKVIAQFRRKLCSFLEDGEQTRVYNLAIQLYPVSKKTKKEE